MSAPKGLALSVDHRECIVITTETGKQLFIHWLGGRQLLFEGERKDFSIERVCYEDSGEERRSG